MVKVPVFNDRNEFIKTSGKAAYINTGTWSTKALKEAKRYGEINIIASSEDKNFSYIPKDYVLQKIQIICTSHQITRSLEHNFMNFQKFQKTQCWSGHVIRYFLKKIDVSKFDLIYAGAQKNMGPAGTTLVIIKDEILNKQDATFQQC